jgi:hypothetical protein
VTDDRQPRIAPPPSVDDLLAGLTDDSRIGKVDFTTALAADAKPERRETAPPTAPLRRVPPTPAPVIEEPQAEREEDPEPEPEPEPVGHVVKPPKQKKARTPKQAVAPVPGPEPAAAPVLELAPEPEPELAPAVAPVIQRDEARVVEEAAEGVIARMHAAEEAVLRHIEAMEVEATRRYELVTAQAELDAELIRLQSRREAHAIVSAARMRAGDIDDVDDDPDNEGHRLSVFSDAVALVADSTESSLAAARSRREGKS